MFGVEFITLLSNKNQFKKQNCLDNLGRDFRDNFKLKS